MRKEPEIFTRVNTQNVPVSDEILIALEREEINESMVRKYIRNVLVERPYSNAAMFLGELAASFYKGKNGALVEKFPDGCEVRIQFREHMDPDTVRFDSIETVGSNGEENDECYRKGYARSVMNVVTAKADMFGITLELEVGPYGLSDAAAGFEDLYRFYGSVGFVASPDDYGHMIREPK